MKTMNNRNASRARVFGWALALCASPALAQHAGHVHEHAPTEPPAEEEATQARSETQAADPHAGHAMPASPPTSGDTGEVDHAAMGHASPEVDSAGQPDADEHAGHSEMDHAAMGHHPSPPGQAATPSTPEEVDHAAMGHQMPQASPEQAMGHHGMAHDLPADAPPREPIPALTAADRAAAFPDVAGHAVHDNAIHSFWLVDRLETWNADEGTGIGWEAVAWIGTDLDRLWLRTEGEHVGGSTESVELEVLYGRAISRWWDMVVGLRQDFGEGPSQTFAAIGVIGLAPYMFEVEATAYVGTSGQTAARVEVEYETLFTNRLILQWLAEAELHGKDDPRRGIGAGLSTLEAGLRLRYEFTRKFAPYIGVARERAFGKTADLRRASGGDIDDTRFVIGLRTWF
jgi:copper resistance protein B